MAKIEVHAANFEFVEIYTGGIGARDQFNIRGKQTNAIMDFRDLTHLEVVTQDTYKKTGAAIGTAVAGGLLLGGVGALAGAYFGGNKNTVTIAAEWSDGKKMMATVPADIYKTMQGAVMKNQYLHTQAQALASAETADTAPAATATLTEAQTFGGFTAPATATNNTPPTAYQDPNANLRLKDGEHTPSAWLWFGILLAPMIFSWFTLNKKYKKSARLIAFGWMVLFLLLTALPKK